MSEPLPVRPLEGHHDEPLPARPHRLYVAVTTDCNRSCPWCSTASKPGKTTTISRETFEGLLPRAGRFEVQLEGGEPLLHPELFALVRLARDTGRCDKVVIATNAVLLPWRLLPRGGGLDRGASAGALRAWLAALGAPLVLKVSVNHHLIERDARHVDKVALLVETARGQGVECVVNVRRRRDEAAGDDAWVVKAAADAGLLPHANVFFLQRYGFARDDERLEPPHLVALDFTLANPDGRTFGQDLIARSDAMEALP